MIENSRFSSLLSSSRVYIYSFHLSSMMFLERKQKEKKASFFFVCFLWKLNTLFHLTVSSVSSALSPCGGRWRWSPRKRDVSFRNWLPSRRRNTTRSSSSPKGLSSLLLLLLFDFKILMETSNVCVLICSWYTSWERYVERPSEAPRPGPIDNNHIIEETGTPPELRRLLVEGKDYVLVPLQVWNRLFEWWVRE